MYFVNILRAFLCSDYYLLVLNTYNKQRRLDKDGNPVSAETQLKGTLLILNAIGWLSPEGRCYFNGQEFNNRAELENYKNQYGYK